MSRFARRPAVSPPESQSGEDSLACRAECRVRLCASKGAARPRLPCVLPALWQGQTSVWGENCSTLENTWASASLEAALALRGLWGHGGPGRMEPESRCKSPQWDSVFCSPGERGERSGLGFGKTVLWYVEDCGFRFLPPKYSPPLCILQVQMFVLSLCSKHFLNTYCTLSTVLGLSRRSVEKTRNQSPLREEESKSIKAAQDCRL